MSARADRLREIYHQRRAAGVCVKCGITRCEKKSQCKDCRRARKKYNISDASHQRQKALRDERRASGLCIVCGAPSPRFSRCKAHRDRRNALQKKRMAEFESVRGKRNERMRVWRANRIEVEAKCVAHGEDLPCGLCSEARHDYWVNVERKPTMTRRRCGKCGSYDHGSTSNRCPKRFSVDADSYATSRHDTGSSLPSNPFAD